MSSPGSNEEIDLADIIREVDAAFERYEAALRQGDQAVLDELFWDDERVVRFGIAENLYGKAAITAFRKLDSAGPKERRVVRKQITTFGAAFAIVNAEIASKAGVSRQSQAWVRLPGGWRIAGAHVSRPLER